MSVLKPNNAVHPSPIIEEKENEKEEAPSASAAAAATPPTPPKVPLEREDTIADLSDEEVELDPSLAQPLIQLDAFSARTTPEGQVSQYPLAPTGESQNNGGGPLAKNVPEPSSSDLAIPDLPLLPGHVGENGIARKDSDASEVGVKRPRVQGNIDALKNVGHLLIKQINKDKEDFANVPNNYDIVAKGIGRIFIGKEETHPEVRAKVRTSTNISQAFRMSIFDVSTGHEVLRIDRKGVNDAPTFVVQIKGKNNEEQLGVITFETGCLMMIPTYLVQDQSSGEIILKIIGPPSGRLCHSIKYVTSTFDIFDGEGRKRVAKITKDGDFYVNVKEAPDAVTKEENLYIDFEDINMDIRTKALILGTTFMLDYTYYKEPSFLTKFASFCCVVLPCCCKT